MTTQEFMKLVVMMEANWYNFKAIGDKEKLKFWYEKLKDLEYQRAEAAVNMLIDTLKFPPTIADIKDTYRNLGRPQISKVDVIGVLNQAVSRFGVYRTVEAMEWIKEQDADLHEVVKAIGFRSYCHSNPEFTNNTVLKMYDDFRATNDFRDILQKYTTQIGEIKNQALLLCEG